MSEPERNGMAAILEKIGELTAEAADDDYIFRGEPECYEITDPAGYGKVTSSLYRQYEEAIEAGDLDVEIIQSGILLEAQGYTDKTSDELLSELQHYGSKTNLIDFTTDLHIALFFACRHPDKDGRIILQRARKVSVRLALHPRNRVISQKSVFVHPIKGFIKPEPGKVILMPKELKSSMLTYLRKYHGIVTKTLFSDLHGFIAVQGLHFEAYSEFFKGNTLLDQEDLDRAIYHYTESIRLRPDVSAPYVNRGFAHERKGDLIQAFTDYGKAIELDPENPLPYVNRGRLHLEKGEDEEAVKDCTKVIDLNGDFAEAYYRRGIAWLHLKECDKARSDLLKAKDKGMDLPEEIRAILPS